MNAYCKHFWFHLLPGQIASYINYNKFPLTTLVDRVFLLQLFYPHQLQK